MLHSIVRIRSAQDVMHFRQRLDNTAQIKPVFRVLSVLLEDNGRSEHNRLISTHLERFWHNFSSSLKELWIETRSLRDDPVLAHLIGQCHSLNILVVEHSSLLQRDDDDDSYSERSPDLDWENPNDTDTLLEFPSLFSTGLPPLSNLKHVMLVRLKVDGPASRPVLDWTSRLYSLCLIAVWLNQPTLTWLLSASKTW